MQRRRVLRGFAALAILSSVAVACGDDDDADQTSDTPGAEAPEVQEIDVTAIDYSFSEAPTEIDAGVVTLSFTNDGKVEHEAAFAEIGDTPLAEYLPKFDPVFAGEGGGPIPAETESLAAPVETGPGETATATFTLDEGTYALFCTFDGDAEEQAAEGVGDEEDGEEEPVTPERLHYNRGMAQVVTVGPASGATELAEADGAITAVDYSFEVDVDDGDTTFNFVNQGPNEIHFVGISSYPAGTDAAAVEEAFTSSFTSDEPPEGAPEFEEEEFAFSGVFSSGLGSRVELEDGFEAGKTYLLACFVQDRAGGPPHAFPESMGGHGMYEVVTVE
jgi:plastocyanin